MRSCLLVNTLVGEYGIAFSPRIRRAYMLVHLCARAGMLWIWLRENLWMIVVFLYCW